MNIARFALFRIVLDETDPIGRNSKNAFQAKKVLQKTNKILPYLDRFIT